MSKFKFNPLTGDFNVVPDSGTLIQKLNPVTGDFNLTKEAGKYKQVLCALSGEFNLRPAITQVIVHGVGSIQLTNAVENGLLSLKAYGGTEQSNLPKGYTQLDSITSQSGAYIKSTTDIANLTKVVIDVDINIGGTTTQWLFGKYVQNKACSIEYAGSNGKIVCDLRSSANRLSFTGTQVGRHLLELDVTDRTFTVDDTLIGTAGTSGTMAEGIYGLVGGFYNSFMSTFATYYGVKVWENDILVYDLVPCKNANDEVGMYNLVNGQFMGSDGEGTFIAGNIVTPIPTSPMNIISNNGVIKARHQSGLPIGYTLLDYIQSGGSNYIDTGIKLTNEDVVEMQYLQTADKGAIYGEYYNGTANMSTTLYGNVTFYFYPYNAQGNAVLVGNYDANVHTVVHNFVDGYIDFDGVRTTFDLPNPNSFTNILNCPIFGRSNGSSIGYFSKTKLYYFRIRRNGTLILDLIPAKDSNNTVGMYDRVSGTLFTESGSGSFIAGNTVSDPMTVYADGITETIEITGKNLNGGGELENKGYTSTGGTSTSTTFCGTLWKIKVKEGEKYTVSYGNFPNGVSGVFVNTWKTDGTWNLRQAISIGSSYTYTIPSGIGEVNFTLYKTGGITIANNSWLQVEKGDTATSYQPYFDGGTATAETLLKIGDYVDEQEILSGNITRKVGIKVLDGTEDWKNLSGYFNISKTNIGSNSTVMPSNSHNIICSHLETKNGTFNNGVGIGGNYVNFKYDSIATTLVNWKQRLSDQYNAGTPVIIVYPLATPTTESVAGQTMNIPAGDSTIEIVQASLDNLELEATYEQEA